MSSMNPESVMAIQPELTSGESILWADQPNPHVIFHKEDVFLIPFSLLWGGFAIFWEAGVSGFWGGNQHDSRSWVFGMIWGIPFVLIGQYLIWGRFIYDAWLKKRTHYAVTSRRVIVVQTGWKRQMVSAFLDSLPALAKEGGGNGPGTLRFDQSSNSSLFSGWTNRSGGRNNWAAWNSMSIGNMPIFRDIDNLDYVYRLVSDHREKSRPSQSAL
jgi:hypothetical protein